MIKVLVFDLNGVLFPTPRRINKKVYDFVKECKSLRYMLVIASNASKGSFEWRSNEYDLMDVFDGRIISSDIGMRKPSKKFFKYMVDVLDFKPKQMLFIDDSQINIDSAKRLGINCIKYKDENSLNKIRKYLEDDKEK